MYPVELYSQRVILREFREDDLDASLAIVADPEVTAHLSFDTRSREQQAVRLQSDIERAATTPRPDYYLAHVDRSSHELIGFIRIGMLAHRAGELGYATRRDRWRGGMTKEASQLMIDFAFQKLNLHRLQAACGPENIASQRLLQRLGFLEEGRMRDHVFTNGQWRDSILYSLINQ